ncbi:MAG: T9SS type B sorting domain-containing protein [Aquaticitalea sp.]
MFVQISNAQLGFCTGNSGNPIFTETFGTGVGQSALPANTTSYTYSNGAAPEDGFYTVSNTTNFFDWFVIQDHTDGDTDGKMLVINSDFTPGQFYRTTINGLCANTSYEFSSWLINLTPAGGFCGSGAIPINVSFEIWDDSDTNLLASGSTGDLASTNSPSWLQYGLVFQTLAGQTSVILKMKNNGTGGCGNDLAIDDVVFKSCGDNVVLEDNNGSNRFEACIEDMVTSVPLEATPDFSVFSTHAYQWQVSIDNVTWSDITGATNSTYNAPAPAPTGTLYYRVKFAETASALQNSSCNSLSNSFEIRINALAAPTFSPIPAICNGDTFMLPTTSNNDISGTWMPALDNTVTTTYTFTPNAGQCALTEMLTVVVNQPVSPSFDSIQAICSGDTFTLPTVSLNNINGIWSPAPNYTETTTYRFTPDDTECAETTSMTVVVNRKPIVELEDIYIICMETNGTEVLQNTIIETNLSTDNYSFEWKNSVGEIVGTNSYYQPLTSGEYSVSVGDLNTGCQAEVFTNVIESNPPVLNLASTSNPFASNGTIEVSATGDGIYEFSLDNGLWQVSPVFMNVSSGTHIVTARDMYGCGYTSINVCLIGYSKFFTPNGDNINETWNIKGASCIDNANISIYDRYGKLLKQINSNGQGWNGTFNDTLLPTDDYWFVIEYLEFGNSNVRQFMGHFTLKR